jgi:phosphopantetheine adenylyltransferase
MKSFSRFLFEAKKSLAAQQAARLGLVGDGHGGWYDKNGEFTAKTEGDRLKFYNQNQRIGKKDPPQDRSVDYNPQFKHEISSQKKYDSSEKIRTDKGSITVAFGRFNPPTIGHEKLLNTVSKIAGKGEYKIYPSRSNDPKKNPLDPDTKISVMKQMYPKHGDKIVNDSNSKTIFDVLKQAHADGYSSVNIVVGADRLSEFEKLATKYNGQLYDFSELNVISAGERDPDADDVTGMSASKLRKAAAEGDFKTFRTGIPSTLDDKSAKNLYMTLRKSMKINENFDLWQIAPKLDQNGLRINYINNKIFKVGEFVENLNTGMIGKIIRRGANYLICLSEDDIMFKPWIKDVVEWTNVSGVPSHQREVGTDSYRKYTMKMTGSKEIKNFINKYKKNTKSL